MTGVAAGRSVRGGEAQGVAEKSGRPGRLWRVAMCNTEGRSNYGAVAEPVAASTAFLTDGFSSSADLNSFLGNR